MNISIEELRRRSAVTASGFAGNIPPMVPLPGAFAADGPADFATGAAEPAAADAGTPAFPDAPPAVLAGPGPAPEDLTLTAAELAAWEQRTAPERENRGGLADPVWRLANLYTCLTEDGQAVHFVPSPEQRLVIWCVYARGWRRLIIPKARQLGMSLLLSLLALDSVCFREGFHAALVDKTEADAEKKHREKIRFAWEKLPACLRGGLEEVKLTADQLIVREVTRPDAPESSFTAGINFRGGTVEMLWVSEWGAIQDTDRKRSREINAGALPAVERAGDGLCVIETTWKGGLDGELGPYVREAQSTPEARRGPRSWRVLFFGWQTCPLYRQEHGWIDSESAEYFAAVATAGVHLDREQKLWYAEKRRTAASAKSVREEYPTLVHECWENQPAGSIYGTAIETARAQGRVTHFETDRWPVHTFWDLGLPVNTVTWYAQVRPEAILILDVDMELDIDLADRAARMRAKGWNYGCHFLPWEAGQRTSLGTAPVTEYARFLGQNVRVVPQIGRVTDGIQLLHRLFPRLVFHAGRCGTALQSLARYRAERESVTGIARDIPVHDRYSHPADALRQLAQALHAGLIEGGQTVGAVTGTAPDPASLRALTGFRR